MAQVLMVHTASWATWEKYFKSFRMTLEKFIGLLAEYKYLVLYPLCIAEGPIIAVLAGLLCASGVLNWWLAYPLIVLGDLTGDSIVYVLGRWGTPQWLQRLGNWMGFHRRRLARARQLYVVHPFQTVALSKILLGIGVAGVYLAGKTKMSYPLFIGICLLTSGCMYIFYTGLGYLSGHAYHQINQYLNIFSSISLVIGFLLALFFIIHSIRKRV